MGSRLAAFLLDMLNSRPSAAAEPNPKLVQKTDLRAGKDDHTAGITQVTAAPSATPSNVPMAVRVMASRVNRKTISCRLAPSGLRTLIWRMRSVKDQQAKNERCRPATDHCLII